MAHDLNNLETYNDRGSLRVVVESPRGSSLKLDFDPKLRLFTISRKLLKEVRQQIEQFFVSSVAFTGKQIMVKGWGSARMTKAFIDRNSAWIS